MNYRENLKEAIRKGTIIVEKECFRKLFITFSVDWKEKGEAIAHCNC